MPSFQVGYVSSILTTRSGHFFVLFTNKKIKKEDLEIYLNEGWLKGRK
jgi:hypothetical protein